MTFISTGFGTVAILNPFQSLAYTGINGTTFSNIGTPFPHALRVVCVTNTTDGDMSFSIDGTHGQIFVPASSFKLYDVCANQARTGNMLVLPTNTQFSVKYLSAPTKGSVYVEGIS